ncbi:hypothetical protein P170DRAFT_430320 [Aspergillus steynii IBT 23096]|uniref:Uncharacterized protein n=1 Tax=Aspergillus steynii IBT 23096 TaxID=1392250 RepID=A0A2I2FUY7_9EURO|nr:uncharacterized protein P170DRAFT_430320 [Aspergillus steynii IBT 23096]PLB44421.1 hypothetical protein P170DRAFT_430320 [Aspergillus steynii IBT 23096]
MYPGGWIKRVRKAYYQRSALVETLPRGKNLGALYIIYVNIHHVHESHLLEYWRLHQKGHDWGNDVHVLQHRPHRGSPVFRHKEAPRYRTGFRAFYISVALMIVIEVSMVVYLWRRNVKKEKEAANTSSMDNDEGVSMTYFQDFTDKEHPKFRYVV